jgi:3-methyl-2-oxobutanoate hydroxymethyltransferase
VPRHAKVYANFAAEEDRLQQMRIEAMGRFVQDVHQADYPAPQYMVDSEDEVVKSFRNWLDEVV